MPTLSGAMRPAVKVGKSRERLACSACRDRKLKCDRNTPCGSCVRRRDAASCSYEPPGDNSGHSRQHQAHAETRLERLEQLVELLAGQRTNNTSTAATEITPPGMVAEEPSAEANTGSTALTLDVPQLSYSGTTHWLAVLEDIQTLGPTPQSSAGEVIDTETAGVSPTETGLGVMFGAGALHSRSVGEVLNRHLPSRRDTDRLVSTFFRTRSYIIPFIHSSQFLRHYHDFWTNPGEMSPLWVSILFSILYIAANITKPEGETERAGRKFSDAAAQCLILGEYFRPKAFVVEALLLYIQSLYITSLELPPELGSILGLVIHLATISGYHRESMTANCSPFTKEMRRRTWSVCVQLDLLVSFHMGLPCKTRFSAADTHIPSNLLDFDFDEDSIRLPVPRPDNELTGVSFCSIKHRFVPVFEKILHHVLTARTHRATDTEVDSLDGELKDVYRNLPEIFRPQPIANSVVDPPSLVTTRLCISFMYYKCICALHRPHVTSLRLNSIQECYTASVALIRDITYLYAECRPGGQFDTEEWFMKSITWCDLLLGATTLCLVLCTTSQKAGEYRIDEPGALALLEEARGVINAEQAKGNKKDSTRVLSLVNATISHIGRQDNNETTSLVAGLPTFPSINVEQASQQEDWCWTRSETNAHNDTSWAYLE
ncbi:unnamed protein product [Clonostachys rhizophaga]|uniref:Zn(2)-C6 fungal-type domain-containing protein n=1 Tax=Clonostachys rhizophaga TaxID=160324 RepID=A0A9N9VXK4_9HYPO|nr:unnamed protein product [Clonostachys rhizophaga]